MPNEEKQSELEKLECQKLEYEIAELRAKVKQSRWDQGVEFIKLLLAGVVGICGFAVAIFEFQIGRAHVTEAETAKNSAISERDAAEKKSEQLKATNGQLERDIKTNTDSLAVLQNEIEAQKLSIKDRGDKLAKKQAALDEVEDKFAKTSQDYFEILLKTNALVKAADNDNKTRPNGETPNLQLQKAADEARKAIGVQIEVYQKRLHQLPSPLEEYALYVGSVGISNAEDCLVFKKDAVQMTEEKVRVETVRTQLALAHTAPVLEKSKIRTGDRLNLFIQGKDYVLKVVIQSKVGADSVLFVLE